MKTYQIILIIVFLLFVAIGFFIDHRENEPIKEKANMYRSSIFGILFLASITLCLTSGFVLVSWAFSSNDNDEIINTYVENKEIVSTVINDKQEEIVKINFDYLKAINKNVQGWLIVLGTNINYPVPQVDNNSYYLNHSFENKKNQNGWLFLDYRNQNDGNDKNLIIYGHNRINGTLFGSLGKFISKSWIKNQNEILIKYITIDYTYIYQVFSSYTIEEESYYLSTELNDFNTFFNKLKTRSIYKYGVEINEDDKILTLSTCYGDNSKRIVIHAKLINKELN